VAVVDLQMPGTDGAQVLKILKKKHKFIEIIMLTGHATVDSAVECTKLGAFKYLEKPYDFDKLVETLKEAYQARLQKKFESNLEANGGHSEAVHAPVPPGPAQGAGQA
jgi:DNA-binding NtrC family response regulator